MIGQGRPSRWRRCLSPLPLAAILPLGWCGCQSVPRPIYQTALDEANLQKSRYAEQQSRLSTLERERAELAATNERLSQQLAVRGEIEQLLEARIENLRRSNEQLQGELTTIVMMQASDRGVERAHALFDRLPNGRRRPDGHTIQTGAAALAAKNSPPSALDLAFEVPPSVRQRLTEIARKFEGIRFDPVDQVCRFQTELAFVGGGDRLRPECRAALRELVQALNAREARPLNIQIVAHTYGEEQVTRELMAQHPTDWHLAAHQAIAFQQYLEEYGLSPTRMGVVSYGSQQPLVSGNDDVAKRTNARVEIFLMPPDPPAE